MPISPDIRAAAMADLLAGDQPAVVAARYHLNPATVRSWRMRLDATQRATQRATPDATPDATLARRPKTETQQQAIGTLILDLLRAKLEASAAIARAAQNPDWLAGQSAADLAALGTYLDQSAFALGDRLADPAPSGE
jgi:hypothetical protein